MRERERNDVERDRGENEVTQREIDGDRENGISVWKKRINVRRWGNGAWTSEEERCLNEEEEEEEIGIAICVYWETWEERERIFRIIIIHWVATVLPNT
jgi:hypothetical protein